MSGPGRWYRILLLAFPRHYRRVRGQEMLATLLDGMPQDRVRPPLREAAGIIAAGVRCRLRIGRSPATRVAAVCSALAGVILTGMAGVWLAWSTGAAPLPSQPEAAAIAWTAVAQDPTDQRRFDFLFGDNGYDYASGSVEFEYAGNLSENPSRLLTDARRRLLAAGWSVDDVKITRSSDQPGASGTTRFEGHKGGIRITMNDGYGTAELRLWRAEPTTVPLLAVVGGLIGGLCGWLLTARVSRRTAHQHRAVRVVTIVLTSAMLLTLLPACYGATVLFVQGYDYGPPWLALIYPPLSILTEFGFLIAILTIALNEIPIARADNGSWPKRVDPAFSPGTQASNETWPRAEGPSA